MFIFYPFSLILSVPSSQKSLRDPLFLQEIPETIDMDGNSDLQILA